MENILPEQRQRAEPVSRWILITKGVVPMDIRSDDEDPIPRLTAAYPDYDAPTLLQAGVSKLMNYLKTDDFALSETCCQEICVHDRDPQRRRTAVALAQTFRDLRQGQDRVPPSDSTSDLPSNRSAATLAAPPVRNSRR